ncbi:MAG TPA: enoyl-CoA hydratase/isomerase family protein [Mycobacterium sp.]|nr:enoyl-CoA hydratase/isomerase family protein [Mycobacterium sp.]
MSRYSSYEMLAIEVTDQVATVVLNRPEARNSFNADLIGELRTIWDDLADDHAVHAILLTGAGSYFSVGGDVKAMSERPGGDVHRENERFDPAVARRLLMRLLEVDKPIVCAINGDAVGLAATIALFCDITVMSEQARIGDTHVSRVGLVAGDGGAAIWPLLVGISRAKEFLMRGTLLSGTDAAEIGLVNHVVPGLDVLSMAREIALELAHGPVWATRWTKLSVNQLLKERINAVFPASSALEEISFHLEDHKEATRAFTEKRKPVFNGR